MTRPLPLHQYVHRASGEVLTEQLFGDRIVNLLYSETRERAPAVFRALTGKRMSSLLGWANFDLPLAPRLLGNRRFLAKTGVDLGECVEPPEYFTTPRRIFERLTGALAEIWRHWVCRVAQQRDTTGTPTAQRRAVVNVVAQNVVFGGSLDQGPNRLVPIAEFAQQAEEGRDVHRLGH